ncbi:MAG: hypothetical protein H7245_11960 [Candidatus Saccharibacteria bacterium]|nr:hypothetical protein [Pseudorhodobacter sp.]
MSNPDSFIDEVTDEVRRDRLFAAFRKYGWIGVVVVLAIVGGAAWNEWQKSAAATRAEAFGDAALAALAQPVETRAAALAALPADRDQRAIRDLLLAAGPDTDKPGALAALDQVAADAAAPQVYRDLAVLRRVALAGADQPLADRRTALQGVAVPGRPFRVLAEEQLAYLLIEEAKPAEALTALTALIQDQEAPSAMRARLALVITALGGVVPQPAAAPAGTVPANAG